MMATFTSNLRRRLREKCYTVPVVTIDGISAVTASQRNNAPRRSVQVSSDFYLWIYNPYGVKRKLFHS